MTAEASNCVFAVIKQVSRHDRPLSKVRVHLLLLRCISFDLFFYHTLCEMRVNTYTSAGFNFSLFSLNRSAYCFMASTSRNC